MTWGKADKSRIAAKYIATAVNCCWRFSRRDFRFGPEFRTRGEGLSAGTSNVRPRRRWRRNSMFNSNKITIKLTERNVVFIAKLSLKNTLISIPVNCSDVKHIKYIRLRRMTIREFRFVTILLKLWGHFIATYWDHDKAKTIRKE